MAEIENDDDEFSGEMADDVEAYWCSESHLHIVLKDDGGQDIAGIALELEDGLDLVQTLMQQIEEMTGLMFVLIEPDEMEEDTIGPVAGTC